MSSNRFSKPFTCKRMTPVEKDRQTYMMGVQRSLFGNLNKLYSSSESADLSWTVIKAARIGSKDHAASLSRLHEWGLEHIRDVRGAIRNTLTSDKMTPFPMRIELATDILNMLNGFEERLVSKGKPGLHKAAGDSPNDPLESCGDGGGAGARLRAERWLSWGSLVPPTPLLFWWQLTRSSAAGR